MKKKIFIVIILLLGLFTFKYFWDKHSYADQKSYFSVKQQNEKNLEIGIIGDSWLVRQDLDSLVDRKLLDQGIDADVFSSGNPGAKTKLIYENLFKDDNEEFSSKNIIEKHPDYCIVVAGVNDAATHVGPDFYSYHMRLIINTLLHYKIKPIIVSLPEFGLEEDFEKKNFISEMSNNAAELLLNEGEKFELQDYRNTLLKDLHASKLDKKIILLNFDEVSDDYDKHKDLYSDPLHLNKNGYQRFSEFLAKNIINLEHNK